MNDEWMDFGEWLQNKYGIGAMDLTDDDYDALYEEYESEVK